MSATATEILWTSRKNDTSNDSEQSYEVSSLVVGIAGSVCAPIVFALLGVVVCAFRAYKTTFQRLLLYHIAITLWCECSFVLMIQINSPRPHPRWHCVTAIHLRLYCILSWYVYTAAVTNYLFLLTLRLLRGNSNIWQHGKFAECFCVFLSLALPAAYIWIPIRDGTYAALHCDNLKVPSTKWDKDAIIFDIAVLVLFLEALVVSIILCSLFCYLRRVYRARRQLTALLKHFIYHTGISSIIVEFAILTSTSHLYRYHRHPSSTIIVDIIIAVILPLVMLVSAVFQTLLSIRHQNGQYYQKICKICCKCKAIPRERPYMETDGNELENQTNPPSNPLNQLSHTYFSVPYTGAFTQVTSDEHYRCIGEHTPLISSGNNDQ